MMEILDVKVEETFAHKRIKDHDDQPVLEQSTKYLMDEEESRLPHVKILCRKKF